MTTLFTVSMGLVMEFNRGTFSTLWNYVLSDINDETTGVIVASDLDGFRGLNYHKIYYTYTVNNTIYKSKQINYRSRASDAYELVKFYRIDKAVTVYFDSEKPEFSVLQNEALSNWIYIHLASLAFIYFIFYFIFSID